MSKSNTNSNQALESYFEKINSEVTKDEWAPNLVERVLKIKRPKRIYEILVFGLAGASIIAAVAMLTAREDPNAPPMYLDSPAAQATQNQIGR